MDDRGLITSCRCTCPRCILELAKKYEKSKNFAKAMQVFDENIQFLKSSIRSIEKDKEQMKRRMLASRGNKLPNASNSSDNNAMKRADSKERKFRCPVAIFDEIENSSVKAMYPKHLVYADGKDIQLEEIRAMFYSKKPKAKDMSEKLNTSGSKNTTNTAVSKSCETESFQTFKNLTKSECPVLPEKSLIIAEITQPKEMHSSESRSIIANISTGNFERNEEKLTKLNFIANEIEEKQNQKEKGDDKENILPNPAFWTEDGEDDEFTCSTKVFCNKILPSSTPFQIRKSNKEPNSSNMANGSLIGEPVEIEVPEGIKSAPNLSMILELSKERFSQSTSNGRQSNINSKTFVICEKKSSNPVSEESDLLNNVIDPFNESLIDFFLERMKFPKNEHMSGYIRIKADMPAIRPNSSVKLGLEKYITACEIGKGAYARVLKVHIESKSSKAMALKQQKPACKWEWYINKEISFRLKDKEKERYFMKYTKTIVFNNGSVMLSDWACYGTILTLINSIKTSATSLDKCPMNVCFYLGIQLLQCIEFLHSCQIIHGDVKPDNFVLTKGTNSSLCVKLIDFGRSIDMTLFPPNKSFNHVVSTENFTCNEMKENKPWTYQTDLFGLASTLYLLLMGDYLKTIKREDNMWVPKKSLSRYLNPELWNPIFEVLLNVPSCSEIPNLQPLRERLEKCFYKIDNYAVNHQISNILAILSGK